MSIVFRRVAVLSLPPSALYSELAACEAARLWSLDAVLHGAHAFYVRSQGIAPDLMPVLIDFLSVRGATLLVPAAFAEFAPEDACIHYPASAVWTGGGDAGRLRGRSCHSAAAVFQAEKDGFDYAFLSPVFSTRTHPDTPALGITALAQTCSNCSIPVFALGGITLQNEADCLKAGAFGIAGIRLFLTDETQLT